MVNFILYHYNYYCSKDHKYDSGNNNGGDILFDKFKQHVKSLLSHLQVVARIHYIYFSEIAGI